MIVNFKSPAASPRGDNYHKVLHYLISLVGFPPVDHKVACHSYLSSNFLLFSLRGILRWTSGRSVSVALFSNTTFLGTPSACLSFPNVKRTIVDKLRLWWRGRNGGWIPIKKIVIWYLKSQISNLMEYQWRYPEMSKSWNPMSFFLKIPNPRDINTVSDVSVPFLHLIVGLVGVVQVAYAIAIIKHACRRARKRGLVLKSQNPQNIWIHIHL